MVPSKLALTEFPDEGCHRTELGLILITDPYFPCWNSANRVEAEWATLEQGWGLSFNLSLFLCIQISHTIISNNSRLFPSTLMNLTSSLMDWKFCLFLLTSAKAGAHPSQTCTQSHKVWTSSLAIHPHWTYIELSTNLLLWKFTIIGRALEQAHHKNTLTLFGTFSYQISF